MPSTDQLELLFDVQDSDASADASPLSASPAPRKAPAATPPAPLFPPPASSAPKPAGEPLLTLSPNAAARVPTPCPDPLPPGARWREVDTDPQPIGFVLLRSRRRSIGFVITDDGLRVTAPNWVTLAQIDDAVREKSR